MEFNSQYMFSKAMEYDKCREYEKAVAYLSVGVSCSKTQELVNVFIEYISSVAFDEYLLEKENEALVKQAIMEGLYTELFQVLSFMLFDNTYHYEEKFKKIQSTWSSDYIIMLYKMMEITLCELNDRKTGNELSIARYIDNQVIDMKRMHMDFLKLQLFDMRIWFGLDKEYQCEVIKFCKDNDISVEMYAVILKYSVVIDDAAGVFSKSADMFMEQGYAEYSYGLRQYAMVLSKIGNKAENTFIMESSQFEQVKDRVSCIYIDCNNTYDYLNDNNKDTDKISIIMCSNSEIYVEECILYIKRQRLPKEYKVEILVIQNAESMCSGYNFGMEYTDGFYKVYMHHDTFLVDDTCLYKTIEILKKGHVGIMGVAGTVNMPQDQIWWNAEEDMRLYSLYQNVGVGVNKIRSNKGEYGVEAIDGVFMASCCDIGWREDIFKGWHFYDISQCREYERAGKKVVVVCDKQPWLWHKLTMTKGYLSEYHKYREAYIEEYC